MFLEKAVYDIVAKGLGELKQDRSLVEDFFRHVAQLPEQGCREFADYFLSETIRVVHGYPLAEEFTFPLISVVLNGDMAGAKYLGNDGFVSEDPTSPTYGVPNIAMEFQVGCTVSVYATHPDVTMYLYQLIKMLVMQGLRGLTEAGYYDFGLAGQDLRPDPTYVPANTFVRVLAVNARENYEVPAPSDSLGRAWKLIPPVAQSDKGTETGSTVVAYEETK